MRALRAEGGMSVIELVVATGIFIAVLGAILSTFMEFDGNARVSNLQNDAQDQARRSLTRVAAELRNLASPTNELPNAVEKAQAHDLVFQAVAPTKPAGSGNARNTMRVRYCHAAGTGRLWRQTQTWTAASAPALPETASCPQAVQSGGWETSEEVAKDVVNGGGRAVFTYNAATLTEITEARAHLWVDVNPGERPRETDLETALFLRNQNRSPQASFTATASGSQIVLNGSDSTDPEGKALSYLWYDGTTFIGDGGTRTYVPASSGTHSMSLKVRDPAGLEHTAPAQSVCIVGDVPC